MASAPEPAAPAKKPTWKYDAFRTPLSGTIDGFSAWADQHFLLEFIDSCLRGVGQVIFINNPISGLIFLLAAAMNSTNVCLGAVFGLVASTGMAYLLKLPAGAIRGGIFGYNGFLVGSAVVVFRGTGDFQFDSHDALVQIAPIVVCSALSTPLAFHMSAIFANAIGKPSAVFTFPFHIMTWIWLLGTTRYSNFYTAPAAGAAPVDTEFVYNSTQVLRSVVIGVGEVFFFDTFLSGLLVIGGVLIASRISAVAAVVGAYIGTYTAVMFGVDPSEIYIGLWGYDATLAAICVAGMFVQLSLRSSIIAAMAALFAVMLHGAMRAFLLPFGLPPLTFAAATACSMFTALAARMEGLHQIPLLQVTMPEEHMDDQPEESTA